MATQAPISKVSPALFALVVLCFFMPFISISCQNPMSGGDIELVKMNGIEVAMGKEIKMPRADSMGLPSSKTSTKTQSVPSNPIAGIVFGIACAGIAVGFIAVPQQYIVQAGLGSLGALMLVVLKLTVDSNLASELKKASGGSTMNMPIVATYGMGYWLAFLSFLGAVGLNSYFIYQEKNK
ncbi:MAG: hypothetical protein LH631_05410 [Alkalinema sp. CAN_BIN05]|nr:hypothetical protein [Alkalinema sp. CAN_BIN05]